MFGGGDAMDEDGGFGGFGGCAPPQSYDGPFGLMQNMILRYISLAEKV